MGNISINEDHVKYKFVDALRGIAVILVLIAHNYLGFVKENGLYPPRFGAIVYQAVYGVQLFYIMSAFTLFLSLSKKPQSYLSFLVRRFFRIAPLFYLSVLFYTLLSYYRDNDINIKMLISVLTFTNGFIPDWINAVFYGSWSIAIEMIFYLFVPLLFLIVKDLNKAIVFFVIAILFSELVGELHEFFTRGAVGNNVEVYTLFRYFYLPAQLPVFALGIILFFIIKNEEWKINPLVILFTSIVFGVHYILGGTGIISNFVLLSIALAAFSYSLYLLNSSIFVNIFTVFIGKISYGIYLFHWLVFDLISQLGVAYLTDQPVLNFFIRMIFIVPFCIIVAYSLHHMVELPFQRIGKSFISNKRKIVDPQ